jgi:Hsp70 protein
VRVASQRICVPLDHQFVDISAVGPGTRAACSECLPLHVMTRGTVALGIDLGTTNRSVLIYPSLYRHDRSGSSKWVIILEAGLPRSCWWLLTLLMHEGCRAGMCAPVHIGNHAERSVVAVWRPQGTVTIKDNDFSSTPSIVAYTDHGERLVGDVARRQQPVNPRNTVMRGGILHERCRLQKSSCLLVEEAEQCQPTKWEQQQQQQ